MEMITKNENLCENQTDDPSAEGCKLERRKSGNRFQPAVSAPGKLSTQLIYTLLGFCILLSAAVLIVKLTLKTSDADVCLEDSLWKSNVTKVLKEITAVAAGLRMEFSQWRSRGNYGEAVSSITALQDEISQLTKTVINSEQTLGSIAKVQDEILQLSNNTETLIGGVRNELSQWKSNVAVNFKKTDSSVAELQDDILQLKNTVINSEQTLGSIAKVQDEILQLNNNTETLIGGVRKELSQWKSNVAVNFQKTDSSVAELQDDILQLKNNLQRCPTEWTQFRKSCYQFSSRTQTWTEAQRYCASVDAHLVVINNAEEQDFLRRTLQRRHWIGLSDAASEGDWRWVDGTDYSSSLTYWNAGEPNNDRNGEDCAEVFDNGKWNDLPCGNIQHWICEKSALIPLLT